MSSQLSNEERKQAFDDAMFKARARVHEMDKSDKSKARDLGTIMTALQCGLLHPDTGAQFDALVMLEELHELCHETFAFDSESEMVISMPSQSLLERLVRIATRGAGGLIWPNINSEEIDRKLASARHKFE